MIDAYSIFRDAGDVSCNLLVVNDIFSEDKMRRCFDAIPALGYNIKQWINTDHIFFIYLDNNKIHPFCKN